MEYQINGKEFKTIEVTLFPGESFFAERGSIVYTETGLVRDVEFSNQRSKLTGLLSGMLNSALSGEAICLIRFYNPTETAKKFLLSGSKCAILPIMLQGEELLCRRGCYIASTERTNLSMKLNSKSMLGNQFFQKIEGKGTIFLETMGVAIEKNLGINDSIEVDEKNLVAMQGILPSQVQAGWSVNNILRGEGLSLLLINGPGKVFLSPLSLDTEK